MSKLNRGKTTKLSIRLSESARKNINISSDNLGISAAGVILFELTKILQNPPTLSEVEEMKNDITLSKNHFPLTVNEKVMQQVNDLSERYGMKKNVLVGLIVSNKFLEETPEAQEDLEPKKLMLQVNEELKKKMMEYSEVNYIPLNALVTYSILQGPPEELPNYESGTYEQIFTNVPEYIGELIKKESSKYSIREHFYTSMCIYKQFMLPGGRFYEIEQNNN